MELALYRQVDMAAPVLDLGCGDGLFSLLLFADFVDPDFDDYKFYKQRYDRRGFVLSRSVDAGVDVNQSCVTQAASLGLYKKLSVGDARIIPYPDSTFRTVLSNCVIEHVENLNQVLGEVARVLKGGGKFVFTVPSDMFGNHLLLPFICRALRLTALADRFVLQANRRLRHYHILSPQEWQQRLHDAGLRLVRCQYFLSNPAACLWDVLFSLTNLGYKKFTVGAALRQIAYLMDSMHVKSYKCLWLALMNPLLNTLYCSDDARTAQGGAGLFLTAVKDK